LVPMAVGLPYGSGSGPTPGASPTPAPPAPPSPRAPPRPGAEARAAPVPPPPANRGPSWGGGSYDWKAGGTLPALSAAYYKSAVYADALRQFNRNHPQAGETMRHVGVPKQGDKIFIPPIDILEQKHGSVIPKAAPASPPP